MTSLEEIKRKCKEGRFLRVCSSCKKVDIVTKTAEEQGANIWTKYLEVDRVQLPQTHTYCPICIQIWFK